MERREVVKNMALAFGYTLSAPALATLVSGCAYDPKVYWTPQQLSKHQAATLESLADAILPETDTPGAKDLGVLKFLDSLLTHVMSDEDTAKFKADLDQLMQTCEARFSQAFELCTPEQKKEFLDELEAENPFQYPRIWGTQMLPSPEKNFFGKLKDMVTWGYFTTELAGETLLAYDPVPGRYTPCMPVAADTKAWSLG